MSENFNQFIKECSSEIAIQGSAENLLSATRDWLNIANSYKYSYHFQWMGRPIIQYPQDIIAVQELIWKVKPDLIIETGIAHGGSLILSASLMALLDMCDAIESSAKFDPQKSNRMALGIDIDIREHNRKAIQAHPLSSRIQMIEGSSVEPSIVHQVHKIAGEYKTVLIFLDSNHTYEHVLAELEAYGPLVSVGSYCVVFDTVIEDMPQNMFVDRPWGPGNSPKRAVKEYLRNHPEYMVDSTVENKLLITVAPDGYLLRIK
jgi:cephalosporin hydroxylase